MNAKLRALLLPILRNAKKSSQFRIRSAADQALFYLKRPPKRAKKAAAARKSGKRAQHQDSTAGIRDAVFQRAGGWCEAPGCGAHGHAIDHWLGGVGRRRPQQSIETCWLLCFHCHALRTANLPTAQHWNVRFRDHCELYGYNFIGHIVHEQMTSAASAPQAPPKALSGDES